MKTITSAVWWKNAALRALYTALAIAVPYLGGALISDVPWLTILSAGGLGFLASLVTSLAGIPEASGTTLPWYLSWGERVVKTFAQALTAGFVGATLITDVSWPTVLQAAAISTLATLVRVVLAQLPNDPTIDAGTADDGNVPVVTTVPATPAAVEQTEAHPFTSTN